MLSPPPGPVSRRWSHALARVEAPGINTLAGAANLVWDQARGANVIDVDGNRYLDLTSGFGVAAIGHRHPRVVEAIARQSERLVHGLGDAMPHPLRIRLARRLARLVPIDDAQTYFAVSGSDAVEVALKTAVLATGRSTIVAFEPSYHGLTLGALAATTRPAFRQPFDDHLHPHTVHLPFGEDLAAIDACLTTHEVAAVLVEPIVGREGVLVPPTGWLSALAERCRQQGALLVVDEIFTGFGRTGRLFAVDHEDVRPDLLCCGKALAGGVPIGAVVGSRQVMAAWDAPGEARHTATFVAHPLACATALATLDVLNDERLVERAAARAPRIGLRATGWRDRFAHVHDVRGRGMLWGLALRDAPTARALVHACQQRGLLLLAGGPVGRVAQLVPPLSITDRQLDAALDIVEQALEAID